jgi:hypothetical protein
VKIALQTESKDEEKPSRMHAENRLQFTNTGENAGVTQVGESMTAAAGDSPGQDGEIFFYDSSNVIQ